MTTITNLFGEQEELKDPGGNQLSGRNKSGGYVSNPMHKQFGELKDARCKTCFHLVTKRYSNTYYKCELRGNVDKCSPQSDHKVNWTACGKYKPEIK